MGAGTKAVVIGAAACVFLLAPVFIVWKFSTAGDSAARAGAWNSPAIKGTFAGLRVQEVDPANAHLIIFYDLENDTHADYRLAAGPDVFVMERLKSGNALSSEQNITLESAAFVPAGNRTRIALELARSFDWPALAGLPAQLDAGAEDKFRQLAASEIADLQGFVLFDRANRYQIELPGNWPAAPAAARGE